jgi:hypothetical protein
MRCLRFAPGRAAARRPPPANSGAEAGQPTVVVAAATTKLPVEIRPVNSKQDRPGASFQVVRHAGGGSSACQRRPPKTFATEIVPLLSEPPNTTACKGMQVQAACAGGGGRMGPRRVREQSLSSRTTLFTAGVATQQQGSETLGK